MHDSLQIRSNWGEYLPHSSLAVCCSNSLMQDNAYPEPILTYTTPTRSSLSTELAMRLAEPTPSQRNTSGNLWKPQNGGI